MKNQVHRIHETTGAWSCYRTCFMSTDQREEPGSGSHDPRDVASSAVLGIAVRTEGEWIMGGRLLKWP